MAFNIGSDDCFFNKVNSQCMCNITYLYYLNRRFTNCRIMYVLYTQNDLTKFLVYRSFIIRYIPRCLKRIYHILYNVFIERPYHTLYVI